MPTVIESIKFSEQAPAGVIRLLRFGKFFRAYDRSALSLVYVEQE